MRCSESCRRLPVSVVAGNDAHDHADVGLLNRRRCPPYNSAQAETLYTAGALGLTSHRLARCAGVPLTGSRIVASTVRLKLAPSSLNGS